MHFLLSLEGKEKHSVLQLRNSQPFTHTLNFTQAQHHIGPRLPPFGPPLPRFISAVLTKPIPPQGLGLGTEDPGLSARPLLHRHAIPLKSLDLPGPLSIWYINSLMPPHTSICDWTDKARRVAGGCGGQQLAGRPKHRGQQTEGHEVTDRRAASSVLTVPSLRRRLAADSLSLSHLGFNIILCGKTPVSSPSPCQWGFC